MTESNKPKLLECTQCGHKQDCNLHGGLWCDNCGDVRIYSPEKITHSERLERDNPWKKVGFHND